MHFALWVTQNWSGTGGAQMAGAEMGVAGSFHLGTGDGRQNGSYFGVKTTEAGLALEFPR